jgi:alpha-ketoglutarate-dependent taurine dioxygenase
MFSPVIFCLLIAYSFGSYVVEIDSDGTIDLTQDNGQHFFVIKDLGKSMNSSDDLIRFGRIFGNIDKVISGTPPYLQGKVVHSPGFEDGSDHCMFNVDPTEYYTRIVKEPGEILSFGEGWHADLTYLKEPPAYSIIRAVELPGGKSRTMFKDMQQVLNDYPRKESLLGLMANHSDNFNTSSIHPVVNRGMLYVNRAFTRNIIGKDDNGKLLNELLDFIDNHKESETVVEWTEDDIVMWDNRFVYHSAIYDYPRS